MTSFLDHLRYIAHSSVAGTSVAAPSVTGSQWQSLFLALRGLARSGRSCAAEGHTKAFLSANQCSCCCCVAPSARPCRRPCSLASLARRLPLSHPHPLSSASLSPPEPDRVSPPHTLARAGAAAERARDRQTTAARLLQRGKRRGPRGAAEQGSGASANRTALPMRLHSSHAPAASLPARATPSPLQQRASSRRKQRRAGQLGAAPGASSGGAAPPSPFRPARRSACGWPCGALSARSPSPSSRRPFPPSRTRT